MPTAVNTKRFQPLAAIPGKQQRAPALGWSGTASGLPQLYDIEESLAEALRLNPEWKLHVMCSIAPQFRLIAADRVRYFQWSEEHELEAFQSMDIGLMPLPDDEWSRGKCSYKMLLYMACGVPVVVSAVGMNVDVLSHGNCGVGVRPGIKWTDSLSQLMRDEPARREAGVNARRIVEEHYSLTRLTPQLASALADW